MSFWSDLLAVISSAAGNESAVTAPSSNVGPDIATSSPWAELEKFLKLFEGIWAELTDGKLWRSLGWLVLGIVLMLIGVSWWLGPSSQMSAPGLGAVKRLM